MRPKPSTEMSSNRPINGDTYVAPALAANKAWPAEKTNVQFVLIPFCVKYLIALKITTLKIMTYIKKLT